MVTKRGISSTTSTTYSGGACEATFEEQSQGIAIRGGSDLKDRGVVTRTLEERSFDGMEVGSRMYLRTRSASVLWAKNYFAKAYGKTDDPEDKGYLVIWLVDRGDVLRNRGIKNLVIEQEFESDYQDPWTLDRTLIYAGSMPINEGREMVHAFVPDQDSGWKILENDNIEGYDGQTEWRLTNDEGETVSFVYFWGGFAVGSKEDPTVIGIDYGDWRELPLVNIYNN